MNKMSRIAQTTAAWLLLICVNACLVVVAYVQQSGHNSNRRSVKNNSPGTVTERTANDRTKMYRSIIYQHYSLHNLKFNSNYFINKMSLLCLLFLNVQKDMQRWKFHGFRLLHEFTWNLNQTYNAIVMEYSDRHSCVNVSQWKVSYQLMLTKRCSSYILLPKHYLYTGC